MIKFMIKPEYVDIYEEFDIENLKKLCSVPKKAFEVFNNEKDKDGNKYDKIYDRLVKLLKCLKEKKKLKTRLIQNNRFGRYYYQKNMNHGLLYFPNCIRGFITVKDTLDLDIGNCHPSILLYLFNKYDITNSNLEKYIVDRDFCLKEYNFDKDFFITMINYDIFLSDNTFLNSIHHDIYSKLIPKLKIEHLAVYNSCKEDNKDGSFISLIHQEIEQDIMFLVRSWISLKRFNNGCLIYDGIHLYNVSPEIVDLNSLSKFIYDHYDGINIKLKFKKFDLSKIDKLFNSDIVKKSEHKKDLIDYDTMKCDFEKTNFKCLRDSYFYEIHDKNVITYSRYDFIHRYDELECIYDGSPEKFITKWLEDPKKLLYLEVGCYPPGLECPDGFFNSFLGFQVEDVSDIEITHEDYMNLTLLEKLINDLSNRDSKNKTFFMYYIYDILFNPGRNNGVSILIKSLQGLGKNSFFEFIGNIMGERYYSNIDKTSQVFGQFNSIIKNKILITLDEISFNSTKNYSDQMKSLITNKKTSIENKGKDIGSIASKNFCRFIMLTNKEFTIEIEDKDRRYVVIETTINPDFSRINTNFMKSFPDDKRLQRLFYQIVRDNWKPPSDFSWIKDRPINEEYINMREGSSSIEISFLNYFIDRKIDQYNSFGDKSDLNFDITPGGLFNEFKSYLGSNRYERNSNVFGKMITKLIKDKKTKYITKIGDDKHPRYKFEIKIE